MSQILCAHFQLEDFLYFKVKFYYCCMYIYIYLICIGTDVQYQSDDSEDKG